MTKELKKLLADVIVLVDWTKEAEEDEDLEDEEEEEPTLGGVKNGFYKA